MIRDYSSAGLEGVAIMAAGAIARRRGVGVLFSRGWQGDGGGEGDSIR